MAYGQTGSGKTHTMLGDTFNSHDTSNSGLIPRSAVEIFKSVLAYNGFSFL